MFPYYTAVLAAFLIVLQAGLMLSVGMHRAKTATGVGTGDDPHLERKIRRHGNLAENAALFLVVIGLAEIFSKGGALIPYFAALFAFARASHAFAFTSLDGSHNPGGNKLFVVARIIGAFGTALSFFGIAAYLAYLLVS